MKERFKVDKSERKESFDNFLSKNEKFKHVTSEKKETCIKLCRDHNNFKLLTNALAFAF